MDNMTLSDIAAVTGNHDNGDFGGGMSWVLVILFLLVFGGGGLFVNRTGELGQYATAASQQQILFNDQFNALGNKLNAIGDGISSLGYSQLQQMDANTASINGNIVSEGRALQMQLANCCCDNQRNVDSLRFDMSNYNAGLQATIHAEGEATRAMLQQNKIEALQGQINQLQLQNAVAGVVRYPVASTYSAGANPFCGGGYCGCN